MLHRNMIKKTFIAAPEPKVQPNNFFNFQSLEINMLFINDLNN